MAQYVSVLRHWNFRHESKGRNTILYSALRFMMGMKGLALAFIATAMMAAGAPCLDHAGESAAQIDWSRAEPATVELVDYEFVPNELRLHHDLPYRLHLRNAGQEGHDFTAPDFFSSVELQEPAVLNESRSSVFLAPGQQTEIYFVPRKPGRFALRCADHDWAGMTATITVE
jgi:uncharacterized cupredoxin-like copper-binding protein